MTGDLKYGPGFTHFDYTDPEAVRGGEVRLARVGTFDSLNPFILKGVAAAGWNLIYSRLCEKAQDEPLSEYGHLAESMWLAPDRSSVTFFLRPGARWHDGEPVTAHDIVFSFYTLVRHGTPFYRTFYADVDTAVAEDERTVTFALAATDNRELPVVLGQLRALPRHYWEARDFTKTTLEPPLGSGPYRIESVDPGRSITYARVDGNWDEGLPARRGQHNFDRITYDYYRDDTVAQEALKAGEYDLRAVTSAREWSTGYDHPAVEGGSPGEGGAAQPPHPRHVRLRLQHPARPLRRPARAPRPGPRLRLRVDQRHPLPRALHAHREPLRQLRAGRHGYARRPRAGDPGALPGPSAGRGLRRGLPAPRPPTATARSAPTCARPGACCARPAGWCATGR